YMSSSPAVNHCQAFTNLASGVYSSVLGLDPKASSQLMKVLGSDCMSFFIELRDSLSLVGLGDRDPHGAECLLAAWAAEAASQHRLADAIWQAHLGSITKMIVEVWGCWTNVQPHPAVHAILQQHGWT